MIDIKDETSCAGCYACVNICPKKCITMNTDAEGFWYPLSDDTICIKCGKCLSVCPIKKQKTAKSEIKGTFAVISNEAEDREKSSSGGVFSLLAKAVLEKGGIVVGAAFGDDFKSVEHILIDSCDELHKLQGSKYLQSKINDCYSIVKDYLIAGRTVLFTGTACQVTGLRAYLGKEYDNLYTQDVVCHGVCSPGVWEKYATYREEQAKGILTGVSFREKEESWRHYCVKMAFDNGAEYREKASDDLYMKCFLKDLMLRPSCYKCKFKSGNNLSDITLADFWGIHHIDGEMYDDKGTSLVLIRTDKGEKLFEEVRDKCKVKAESYECALSENPSIEKATGKNYRRKGFMLKLESKPIEDILTKYAKTTVWSFIGVRLRWYVKKISRRRKG